MKNISWSRSKVSQGFMSLGPFLTELNLKIAGVFCVYKTYTSSNWESNIKSNIFWASETPICSIYHIRGHFSSETYPILTTLPTLASTLWIFMGLANQTLAKLKETKDVIFILRLVLAVLRVRNSCGMNTQ